MATVFVAYGGTEQQRTGVLAAAAERAAAAGNDLYVYHVREGSDPPDDELRAEIERVVAEHAPDTPMTTDLGGGPAGDDTNVSTGKQLVDAVTATDREVAYVVMGNVEHGALEGLVLPSVTEAVVDAHAVPVLLVPV